MRYWALSLWQPSATLLVRGLKAIETRPWVALRHKAFRTLAERHIVCGDPLLIHAAKTVDGKAVANMRLAGGHPTTRWGISEAEMGKWPRMAFVGTVEVFDARMLTEADAAQACCPCAGRYGLLCCAAREFLEPVPARGRQGFWQVDLALPPSRRFSVASEAVVRRLLSPTEWDFPEGADGPGSGNVPRPSAS